MSEQSNIIVLTLRSYHCKLNSIEIAWTQIRNEVTLKNNTFKLPFLTAIANITSEM